MKRLPVASRGAANLQDCGNDHLGQRQPFGKRDLGSVWDDIVLSRLWQNEAITTRYHETKQGVASSAQNTKSLDHHSRPTKWRELAHKTAECCGGYHGSLSPSWTLMLLHASFGSWSIGVLRKRVEPNDVNDSISSTSLFRNAPTQSRSIVR